MVLFSIQASLVTYEVAWKLTRDSNDLLWWAIIGLTEQLLHEKIDRWVMTEQGVQRLPWGGLAYNVHVHVHTTLWHTYTYHILSSMHPWALVINGPKNGSRRLHQQACITHIYVNHRIIKGGGGVGAYSREYGTYMYIHTYTIHCEVHVCIHTHTYIHTGNDMCQTCTVSSLRYSGTIAVRKRYHHQSTAWGSSLTTSILLEGIESCAVFLGMK